MIPIKQNRSWSKPDNVPNLIAIKKVDWSIFIYGSHIPLDFHEDFEKANDDIHIELGKSQELELIIEGNSYQASLMNIDRKQVDYDTYQIRYDGNKEIKELMQKKFRTSYQYLKEKRESSDSNKQYIVPEEKSEYIEFYETGEPFKYELKLITAHSDLAKPFDSIFNNRKEAEWAFELLLDTCKQLGVNDLSDERFSVTFRDNQSKIHLNFCDWQIIGFHKNNTDNLTIRLALLKELVSGGYKLVYDFSQEENETEICLYEFEIDSIEDSNENYKTSFNKTLSYISERFKNRSKTQYRHHNNILLAKAIFDQKVRETILTEGLKEVDNTEEILNTGEIINNIQNYISSKGFTYPTGLIENFYLSLKTKPFVLLAGVSGTGKTKLVRLFAEAINCTEENDRFKLISVRPDWSDSSDLLGYKNIKDQFQPGPMIDILKAAMADPDNIYFVCLDEMNLARVEYYFSDFLSIMETRKKSQDGSILTSKLLSEKDFVSEDDKDNYAGLIIPDNLYIVGTVNMDETTHPFSKKVLDRANTIEFSEINLLDYSLASNEQEIDIESTEVSNDFLRSDYIILNDCSKEDNKIISEVVEKLQEINDILAEATLQIGYRVRDEFCFYMLYNQKEELLDKNQAFDFQLMQKILPRIQGSSRSIKNVLVRLFNFIADYNLDINEGELGDLALAYVKKNKDTGTIAYPVSAEKIAYMIKRIEEDGFTAYWL